MIISTFISVYTYIHLEQHSSLIVCIELHTQSHNPLRLLHLHFQSRNGDNHCQMFGDLLRWGKIKTHKLDGGIASNVELPHSLKCFRECTNAMQTHFSLFRGIHRRCQFHCPSHSKRKTNVCENLTHTHTYAANESLCGVHVCAHTHAQAIAPRNAQFGVPIHSIESWQRWQWLPIL